MQTEQTGHLPRCRFCNAELKQVFADLGKSPLCESYLSASQLNRVEPFYPLCAFLCHECFLVQLEEFVPPEEIFTEYAYYSSYSDTWVQHAKAYVDEVVSRFHLGRSSFVVEIASNDGYLLQHFAAQQIPVLGIEPAANVAKTAIEKGIPTEVRFFTQKLAQEMKNHGRQADLIVANNVLAQAPNLNDFVAGIKTLLAPRGVVTAEFPHLLRLMQENQFDTIYHEHFSYFSFFTAEKICQLHGIAIFDVGQLPTHGGSLRIYGRHSEDDEKDVTTRVAQLRDQEMREGVCDLKTYQRFAENVKEVKRSLLEFLIQAKRAGKRIAAYGAPGKGNTLLNYCGIRTDFIDFTVDRNPYKQGKFLPGTHIPVCHPKKIQEAKPDFILILPWNLKEEIIQQLSFAREWGGRFVVPIPKVEIIS